MQDYWDDVALLNCARGDGRGAAADKPCKRAASECELEAVDALARIAARQRKHLFCGRTQNALDAIVLEFEVYLAGLNKPGRDSWGTCSDVEVLVFLEAHYLQQHDGAYGGDVAPSTLARAVSSLTRAFAMRHRAGPWCADPALGVLQGNPCESINIADFQTAYSNAAQEAGQYEVSATPMTLHDFETLMRRLDDDIDLEMSAIARGGGNVQHLVRLCRDAASFSTLWASARRGSDVLQLTWERLHTKEFAQIVQQWLAQLRLRCEVLPCGGDLLAIPISTKTGKGKRAGTWELQARSISRYVGMLSSTAAAKCSWAQQKCY